MKHLYKSIAVLLLLLPVSMTSSAAEPQQPAEPAREAGMQHGMGMGMMGGMSEEQKTAHMKAMQEHMLKMHELSNQILSEQDPAKKEALKNQQLELMKSYHAQMMQHRQERRQEHKK